MTSARFDLEALAHDRRVARAREILAALADDTLADQLAVVRVPAPPFGEEPRAQWVRERLRDAGLADVHGDEVGNVIGRLPADETAQAGSRRRVRAAASGERTEPAAERAADAARPVIVSAHLDTVFPEGTELGVRRDGDRWVAPGISDNARGVAVLIALARALVRAGIGTRRPLVFAATVGEEGVGDLRGVKHLFRDGSPLREAAAFVALDGAGSRRIVDRALGSRRFRAVATGPGGHSWADWGRVNPLHALGRAVAELSRIRVPQRAGGSLTVARMAGGTSVNAIPDRAWFELDVRAEEKDALDDLERRVRRILARERDAANADRTRGTAPLELEIRRIGRRPCGETPRDSEPVRAAEAATRYIGERPERVVSSTDANIAIAAGIPAIALGAGGESGDVHTPGEWYVNDGARAGADRVLLTVLALAGVAP